MPVDLSEVDGVRVRDLLHLTERSVMVGLHLLDFHHSQYYDLDVRAELRGGRQQHTFDVCRHCTEVS